MITIEIEQETMDELADRFGRMPKEVRDAVKKAANTEAGNARKQLAERAKETYTVKRPAFSQVMKISRATDRDPVARISSAGPPLPLVQFKFYAGKRGVKVQVLKEGNGTMLKRPGDGIKAFSNNIASKNQVRKKSTKKGEAGSRVIHKAIAQRKGKERLPVNELFSNSLQMMLASKRVLGKQKPEITRELKMILHKNITGMMGGK